MSEILSVSGSLILQKVSLFITSSNIFTPGAMFFVMNPPRFLQTIVYSTMSWSFVMAYKSFRAASMIGCFGVAAIKPLNAESLG